LSVVTSLDATAMPQIPRQRPGSKITVNNTKEFELCLQILPSICGGKTINIIRILTFRFGMAVS
jgi:hypothetical protein